MGTDCCFLGARDEVSMLMEGCTAAGACKFAIDVHEVRQVLGLFGGGREGSLFDRVHHLG